MTAVAAASRAYAALSRCYSTPVGALTTLAVLVAARGMTLLVLGPGLILDDWTAVGNREFQGLLEIADQSRLHSRPIEWLTYTVVYGIGGDSPVLLLIEVTALNIAAVAALYTLLGRYWSPRTAWIICAAWILVPNHNAMAAWAANTQSVVAVTLLALGVLQLSRGSKWSAALLLTLAVLGYQLTIIPALAATILVGTTVMPLFPSATPPRTSLCVRDRVMVMASIGVGVAWTSIEPTYPLRISGPRPNVYISAHFGEGLFASSVHPLLYLGFILTALAGGTLAITMFLRGDRTREGGPTLVVTGIAIMALGSLGVVLSGSEAYGMTDRLYAITSLGAVIIWIGIARVAYALRSTLGWAIAAAWCAACLYGQAVSLNSWSQAGEDVNDLMAHLEREIRDDNAAIVVGPQAVRRNNIVGLVSPHAPDNALWLSRNQVTGSLRIAKTPDEFVLRDPSEVLVTWP